MFTMNLLVLAAAVPSAGETVLYQFSMQGCGPCLQVAPTVKQIEAEGYPVQKLDLRQHREWARHFQVDSAPTFILVSNGREVRRMQGVISAQEFRQAFAQAGFRPGQQQAAPAPPQQVPVMNVAHPQRKVVPINNAAMRQKSGMSRAPALISYNASPRPQAKSTPSAEQLAMQATVRLRVEDAHGISYGTGTVIDVHGDEALVLTCGHLFRETRGKTPIVVELWNDGRKTEVRGKVQSYDASDRDIALVSMRPGYKITPVQVHPGGYRAVPGTRVFSIGCDHGADPSIRRSHLDRQTNYVGPPYITVAGHPVDGRSGGGLFTEDGMLIGVCNAADMADDKGLYAALETIHWQIDQIGQRQIYQRGEQMLAQPNQRSAPGLPAPPSRTDPTFAAAPPAPPTMPARMPAAGSLQNSIVPVSTPKDDVEVICIVRSRDGQAQRNETLVIGNPSQTLLQEIRQVRLRQSQMVVQTSETRSANASPMPRMARQGTTIRGQNP